MVKRYVTVGEAVSAISVKGFLKLHGYTEHQIRHIKYVPEGLLRNGQPCRAVDMLEQGDVLQILMEDSEYDHCPWPVLYADSEVLVIDKPAGLVVHPSHGHYEDSLIKQLGGTVRIIGRLDQDTSGVLMLARNAVAAERLQKQRWDGRFQRTYLAWVHGVPEPDSGVITQPIGRENPLKNRMRIDPEGLPAITRYKVEESGNGISRVRLWIQTGRTHQIRVHMASIGHPLVGDPIYGKGAGFGLRRTALHASELHWEHPHTGTVMHIGAKIPEDLQKLQIEKGVCPHDG